MIFTHHFNFLSLHLLGNPQEGYVAAVQWMPHKDPTCGCSCHAEWWSGGASPWRTIQQWSAHEEVHANFCTCSRSEYLYILSAVTDINFGVTAITYFWFIVRKYSSFWRTISFRVQLQTSSMSTMTFSATRMRFLETLKPSLMRVSANKKKMSHKCISYRYCIVYNILIILNTHSPQNAFLGII